MAKEYTTESRVSQFIVLFFWVMLPWSLPNSDLSLPLKTSVILVLAAVSLYFTLQQPQVLWNRIRRNLFGIVLMVGFSVSLIVSSVFSFSFDATVFGDPPSRIGVVVLANTVLLSFFIAPRFKLRQLVYFYYSLLLCLLVSIGLAVGPLLEGDRLGGLFMQPNSYATLLLCGFLVGMYATVTRYAYLRWLFQITLLLGIFMTQSRAPIVALLVMFFVLLYQHRKYFRNTISTRFNVQASAVWRYTLACALAMAPITLLILFNGMLQRVAYSQLLWAVGYRLELLKHGVVLFGLSPIFGHGLGNIHLIFENVPLSQTLQSTVNEGYRFSSTHVIFLDKFIETGLLGGLTYVLMTIISLAYGFKNFSKTKPAIITLFLVSITIQYITNVTTIEVEMLYWFCVIYLLFFQTQRHTQHT